jgi:hypothetical protein
VTYWYYSKHRPAYSRGAYHVWKTFRSLLSPASSRTSSVKVQYLNLDTQLEKTRKRFTDVSTMVGSMPTWSKTFTMVKKQLISFHRHCIAGSWNGSCATPFPQFHLNQTVFFSLRSTLSLGSLHACSPPNEESALDAFSDHRRPNIKMNSTVVVTRIRVGRS